MSYVKNYDIGSIRLDAPKKYFIYELPLLSFGDTRGAVGLSLVFNSGLADTNDYYMSKGHKLNLQKSLLIRSGVPGIYEDGDGTRVNLIRKGNCYLFDDDSQRIIRGTSSEYVLENPDYSTETFTTLGLITSVADKYGETYLTYTYESGKLASIKYRTNKFINLSYNNLGTLGSIEYVSGESSVCTISLGYNGAAHSIVTHYSGVRYYTSYSGGVFTAYSTDTGSAYSNDYSHKVICTEGTDTISFVKYIGSEAVDSTTYKFIDYSPVDGESYSHIEVTDFYGVRSRTQYKGDRALCSYEIGDSDVEFTGDKHLGNVQIHRYSSLDTRTSIGEKQLVNEGSPLTIEGEIINKNWNIKPSDIENKYGIWVLTGWIRLINDDKNRDDIELYVTNDTDSPKWAFYLHLPKPPINQWSYFSLTLPSVENDNVVVPISDFNDDIETKDFRLLVKPVYTMPGSDGKFLSPSDSLLVYHGNSTPVYIPLGEATFKCGDVNLPDGVSICYEDLLKYKINKWKNVNTTEFYCDCVRNLLTIDSSEEVTLTYKNDTYNLSDCYLGEYKHTIRGAIITQIIDDSSSYLTIRATDSDGNLISSQNINSNLDVVSSKVNDVTTFYERTIHTATNALFTKEWIPNLYCTETCYTDNAVTVYNVNESDNSNISYVTYNIDPIWGAVTSVVDSEGAKITDTHDDDKCALLSRRFNDNPSISNLFTYESGNLSTLANGSLKYKMSYTNGRLSGISKLDATTEDTYSSIESHSYVNNDGQVTLTDSYPSATNPLNTVTHNYDEYGRLTSISDTLTNTYNSDPCCIYENKRYKGLPGDAYNPDGTAELSFENLGCNNASAKLSTSTDSTTGKTTHYGYYGDRLVAVKTTNSSSTLSKEVFAYDDVHRLTTDRFDYDLAGGKFVKSVITYDDEERSTVTNNRVKTYSYYVNTLDKYTATTNTFDSYGRITQKAFDISKDASDSASSNDFQKCFTYDKTNVKSIESKCLNSALSTKTEYDYDSFGKIVGERYIDTATKNKSYVYDSFGRLVRENNQLLDKTFVYSYNGIGNITSVSQYAYTTGAVSGTPTTTNFGYNSAHPDRLTSFGGKAISYNINGCPISYDGRSYSWNRGKLSRIHRGSSAQAGALYEYCNFSYDGYGRRVSKFYSYDSNPASTSDYSYSYNTTYSYDTSGRLIYEKCVENYVGGSSRTRDIIYLYDESGIIGAVQTYNNATETFYFDRNLLGDVIGIYNSSGTKVASYTYDAFGNCTTKALVANTFSAYNPIRYRGYYYDRETKLYYLNARYYNPEWRRFISPDDTAYLDPESANGLNLYAYCYNDPVNYVDPSGNLAFWAAALIGAGILGLVGLGATAYADFADDGEIFNGSIGADAYVWNTLVAASIGALAGGLIFAFGPSIAAFLGSSFSIPISTFGTISTGGALALAGSTSITLTGAELVFGGALAATGIGISIAFARTGKSGGYYGEGWPGDPHKPTHIHLRGNGADIRIGEDGNPLPNEPTLTSQQRKALKRLWKEFQKIFAMWKNLQGG